MQTTNSSQSRCSVCASLFYLIKIPNKIVFLLLFVDEMRSRERKILVLYSVMKWLESKIWNNWNRGTLQWQHRENRNNLTYFPIWLWRRVQCVVTLTEQQLKWITLFGSLNLITSWEVRVHTGVPSPSAMAVEAYIYDVRCTVDMVVSYAFKIRIDIVHVYVDIHTMDSVHSHCFAKPFTYTRKCNGMCPIDDCFFDISCFLHAIFIEIRRRVRPSQLPHTHTHTLSHTKYVCIREWANLQRNR